MKETPKSGYMLSLKTVMDTTLQSNDNLQIKRITRIGLLANLLLAGIKFVVGWLGSSQAVIADAFHSLSDMVTDFAVIFGVKYWSAPPDEDHPYGHKKIEALITAAIGLVLAAVAVGLGYKSLTTIRLVEYQQPQRIAAVGPLLSIIIKEVLYRWTIVVGEQTKSSAVIANAWHHRSDALSSLPALIAVVIAALKPGWIFVDHIGALIVSIFILKVAWEIVMPSLKELIDAGASKREKLLIEEITGQVEGVKDVHAIRTRMVGPDILVDLHILVDPEMSVRLGHAISEKVKGELIKSGANIIDVVVHLEPFEGS